MPARGAAIGFITFIASMISRVSPSFTLSPGDDERLGARLAGEEDGADHRRLDRAGMAGGRGRRRGGGAGAAARRARRRRRRARRAAATVTLALDDDLAVAVLDLDLGQIVLG